MFGKTITDEDLCALSVQRMWGHVPEDAPLTVLMQDQNETNVENLHSCITVSTDEQGEDEVYDNAIGSVII